MRGSRNFLQGGGGGGGREVQTETFFSPQLILQRGVGEHGMEMYRTPVKQKSAVATMIHGCISLSSCTLDGCVSLPCSAMGLSAVCDCGIS